METLFCMKGPDIYSKDNAIFFPPFVDSRPENISARTLDFRDVLDLLFYLLIIQVQYELIAYRASAG